MSFWAKAKNLFAPRRHSERKWRISLYVALRPKWGTRNFRAARPQLDKLFFYVIQNEVKNLFTYDVILNEVKNLFTWL